MNTLPLTIRPHLLWSFAGVKTSFAPFEDYDAPLELFLRRLHMTLLNRKGFEDTFPDILHAGFARNLLMLPAVEATLPSSTPLETALKLWRAMKKRLIINIYAMNGDELYHFAHGALHSAIEAELRKRHATFYTGLRARCAVYKEELIAAAWSPTRLEAALAAGVAIEDM